MFAHGQHVSGCADGHRPQAAADECDPGCPCLELRNANVRIAELLENIGVLHLFQDFGRRVGRAGHAGTLRPTRAPVSRADLTRTCLEAHELLMTINPENIAKFKDVTKFLAEDLARLKGENQSTHR